MVPNLMGTTSTPSTRHDGSPFSGLCFVLELGAAPLKRKKQLQTTIEHLGGNLDFIISKKTTHVVTTPQLLDSFKLKNAWKHGCFVVTEDFLLECDAQGTRVDEWPFLYIESRRALEYAKDAEAYVGQQLFYGYTNAFSIMSELASRNTYSLLAEATTNITALCLGLGAKVPSLPIHLPTIVNSMYKHISIPLKFRTPAPSLPPHLQPKPAISPRSTTSPRSGSLSSHPASASTTEISTQRYVAPTTISRIPANSSVSTSITLSTPKKWESSSMSTKLVSSPAKSALFPIPPAAKPISYIAQAQEQKKKEEQQRKALQSEQRQAQLDQAKSVFKERQQQRELEEEERKRLRDEQRNDLLERRRLEEEERKQRATEIREAREKKIAEERKKREAKLLELQQKPAAHFTDYFAKVNVEEERRRIEEEWKEFEKEMERQRLREEEEERQREEKAAKKAAEKEAKRLQREAEDAQAREQKSKDKTKRRAEYERKKIIEEQRKKRQEEERKAKSIRDFQEREKKRALKKKLGVEVLPVVKIDYDKSKIFVGGIKMDDLDPVKLGKKYNSIRDERINNLLRLFDVFGEVIERRVFLEKHHFFITYANPGMAKSALTSMQNFEHRKKVVEELQALVKEKKGNLLAVPHTSFYVREPNKKQKPKKDGASVATTAM